MLGFLICFLVAVAAKAELSNPNSAHINLANTVWPQSTSTSAVGVSIELPTTTQKPALALKLRIYPSVVDYTASTDEPYWIAECGTALNGAVPLL